MIGKSAASASGARAVRAAAALHVLMGLAFGIGSVPVLAYFARHGELPMSPFGWRYMAGPFVQLGPDGFTALGWTLVAFSWIDVAAGIWLWQRRPRGFRIGFATDLPVFVLGLGFELPLLLIGVPVRTALAIAGRRNLL
ncbi:MAG: hypothetical protein M3T56_06060 [Chloroflexota bacterium]|nr:hypothetical protein [Chloroflexota bacterium]